MTLSPFSLQMTFVILHILIFHNDIKKTSKYLLVKNSLPSAKNLIGFAKKE